jgi:hypothetical protein
MTEHQKQTAFLRECLHYDDSIERHKLEKGITQLQRNERCVRRAVCLMALLAALAMVGLCYLAIFLTNHPRDVSQFVTPFIGKAFSALALGSLICLVSFVGLGVAYRAELDQRREECRQLAAKLLASRLGKPNTMTGPEVLKEEEIIEPVLLSPDRELAHGASGVSPADHAFPMAVEQ